MNELSLFSGAGGGLLGTKLLGFRHVGYVEWNEYCQQIIAQRIKDGVFDKAPIFTDVREFAQSGAAREYRGFADVVTAGFPCQPFSVAGKRKASDDTRNMWPATMEVIKEVRPKYCFLENVPGLLSATVDDESGRSFHYFGAILRDLAEGGYDARWCVLGADDLGAIHRRKRLWVYAWDTKSESSNISKPEFAEHQEQQEPKLGNSGKQVVTTNSNGIRQGTQSHSSRQGGIPGIRNTETQIQRSKQEMDASDAVTRGDKNADGADTRGERGERVEQEKIQGQSTLPWGENIRSIEGLPERPDIPEPLFCGMDDGLANRTKRLTAIGNGQVPAVVATAWRVLTNAD